MNGEDPNAVNVKEASPEDGKGSQGLSEAGALETEDESVLYFTQKIVEVEKELDQICNVDMQSDLEQLFTQLVSSLVESIQESLGSVHTMVDAYARLEI